ncbi:hypothetical protein HYQ45_017387 [Verticillium longisporum]|uniref:Uncharacterized protein n=1 Tax=Verticillium longisporum TaxID=100787 RepID=A0A8I2Z4K7_VERLO|nr:hypothetical protein HYQ45_017387 [Verticillium longisporum]
MIFLLIGKSSIRHRQKEARSRSYLSPSLSVFVSLQLLPVLSIAACVLALENGGQAAPEAVDSVERHPAAEPDAVPAGLPVSYSRPDVDQPASELLETELLEKAGTEDEWDDFTLRKDKGKKRIKKKILPKKFFMMVHKQCMEKCMAEGGGKKQCRRYCPPKPYIFSIV